MFCSVLSLVGAGAGLFEIICWKFFSRKTGIFLRKKIKKSFGNSLALTKYLWYYKNILKIVI